MVFHQQPTLSFIWQSQKLCKNLGVLGSSLRLVNTPLSPRERGDSMDVSDRDCTSLDHSVAGNAICGQTWLDEPLVISRSYGKSPCLIDKSSHIYKWTIFQFAMWNNQRVWQMLGWLNTWPHEGCQEPELDLRYLLMEPAIKAGNLQAPEIEDFFSPAAPP